MKRYILGFTGPARCGKDTAGAVAIHNGFTPYSFAKPLKHYVGLMFEWGPKWMEEHKDEVDPCWGFSPRKALQLFGTEFGRALDEDLWIKMAKNHMKGFGPYVITDVRFMNEAEYVRQNGLLVHIKRPDCQKVEDHSSENGIPFEIGDAIIFNNFRCAEDFQFKVGHFVRVIIEEIGASR